MQNVVYHQEFNYENIWMHKNKDLKLQWKKIVFRHGIMCIFFPKLKQFLTIELDTKKQVLVFLPQIVIHKTSSEVK